VADEAQPRALIVMGVSGSGKSTIAEGLAKRLGWRCEDGDMFHPQGNVDKMSAGQPLTDNDRWPWLQAIADEIDKQRAAGQCLVVACSALKHAYRDVLTRGRSDVRLVYLDGSKALIQTRMDARKGHFMPPALLDSQFRTLEIPGPEEHALTVSIDAPPEAIIDAIIAQLPAGTDRTKL
jgi:gluconokinase